MYEFKFYNGKEELEETEFLLEQMDNITLGYDFMNEDILQYLDESSQICCMFKDKNLLAFAWLAFCKEQHIAELCWFVTDKNKSKGFESKLLLDKVINFCKSNDINSLKFNCAEQSWGRIKNEKELFRRFGYNISPNEEDYDMSIEIE